MLYFIHFAFRCPKCNADTHASIHHTELKNGAADVTKECHSCKEQIRIVLDGVDMQMLNRQIKNKERR